MQYRKLGRTGLKVSNLCLGAMTFGEADENSMMHKVGCDEDTAHRILDRALDAGINFIDTADIYGQDGLSERVIGSWFSRSHRRDDVVLATKFRFKMGSGPLRSGASRRYILRACEDSLRRLGTDRIDLYQIHMQDLDTPEDETLRALDDLVRQGKVVYIGASNYAAYRLVDSLWISKEQGWERFVALQMQYSLLFRELEREHVPLCRQHGLGLIPWSPLAGGFLSGKYRRDGQAPEGSRLGKWQQTMTRLDRHPKAWAVIDCLHAASAEIGASVPQIALAWLLHKPTVSSVIFGARSVGQLEDNLPAADLALPAEILRRLDEASALELGYPYDFMARVQNAW